MDEKERESELEEKKSEIWVQIVLPKRVGQNIFQAKIDPNNLYY